MACRRRCKTTDGPGALSQHGGRDAACGSRPSARGDRRGGERRRRHCRRDGDAGSSERDPQIAAGTRGAASGTLRRTATVRQIGLIRRSEEHTSELQSLMRISYAVFCLKKKKINKRQTTDKGHTKSRTTS